MVWGRTLLIACLCAAFFAGGARAAAWTQEEGVGFTSQTVRYFTTTSDDNPAFSRVSFVSYVEYGLAEALTLGVELDEGVRVDDAGSGLQTGRISGFLRGRVWRGEAGDAASVQVGATIPHIGLSVSSTPLGSDSDEIYALVAYGRGFTSDWGSGWAEAAFGASHFTGARGDELSLDLTLGLRPAEGWVALAQMFGTFGLRNEAFAGTDFDAAKFQLSVGYEILPGRTALIGIARDVYTRGTDPGFEASLTIWSKF
ncbi:MAG: hypothetical protein AAF360_15325 [Pseudomonadota bacterium]